jgi:uncharacterized membrane protein
MKNKTKVLALAFACIAIVLLAYALLTGEPSSDSEDPKGMWDNARSYSTTNIAIIVTASFLVAVAAMIILLREEYEPLPPSLAPPPPPPKEAKVAPEEEKEGGAPAEETRESPEAAEDIAAEENYLVLRLLTGDERTMFKAIMDSKGEALQKDLIQRTKMSNAKVSRVLEKLEQKGVVSKERYGSTNRIRIKLRT